MTKTEARAHKAAEEAQRALDARTSTGDSPTCTIDEAKAMAIAVATSCVAQLIADLREAGVRVDDEETKP